MIEAAQCAAIGGGALCRLNEPREQNNNRALVCRERKRRRKGKKRKRKKRKNERRKIEKMNYLFFRNRGL
jgi:hypothetical protein